MKLLINHFYILKLRMISQDILLLQEQCIIECWLITFSLYCSICLIHAIEEDLIESMVQSSHFQAAFITVIYCALPAFQVFRYLLRDSHHSLNFAFWGDGSVLEHCLNGAISDNGFWQHNEETRMAACHVIDLRAEFINRRAECLLVTSDAISSQEWAMVSLLSEFLTI